MTDAMDAPEGASDDVPAGASVGTAEGTAAGAPADAAPDDLAPSWLAWLVLVVIVAVVGVGGSAVRSALGPATGTRAARGGAAEATAEPTAADLSRAVRVAPGDLETRLKLAYAYQREGALDKALAEYDTILRTEPQNVAALYNRGAIYVRLGYAKKGEAALWDVLEVDPTHVLAARDLGRLYASKGHYRSLIAAVGPALAAKPWSADLHYLMGLAREKLGAAEQARAEYAEALKRDPQMREAEEGLARMGGARP